LTYIWSIAAIVLLVTSLFAAPTVVDKTVTDGTYEKTSTNYADWDFRANPSSPTENIVNLTIANNAVVTLNSSQYRTEVHTPLGTGGAVSIGYGYNGITAGNLTTVNILGNQLNINVKNVKDTPNTDTAIGLRIGNNCYASLSLNTPSNASVINVKNAITNIDVESNSKNRTYGAYTGGGQDGAINFSGDTLNIKSVNSGVDLAYGVYASEAGAISFDIKEGKTYTINAISEGEQGNSRGVGADSAGGSFSLTGDGTMIIKSTSYSHNNVAGTTAKQAEGLYLGKLDSTVDLKFLDVTTQSATTGYGLHLFNTQAGNLFNIRDGGQFDIKAIVTGGISTAPLGMAIALVISKESELNITGDGTLNLYAAIADSANNQDNMAVGALIGGGLGDTVLTTFNTTTLNIDAENKGTGDAIGFYINGYPSTAILNVSEGNIYAITAAADAGDAIAVMAETDEIPAYTDGNVSFAGKGNVLLGATAKGDNDAYGVYNTTGTMPDFANDLNLLEINATAEQGNAYGFYIDDKALDGSTSISMKDIVINTKAEDDNNAIAIYNHSEGNFDVNDLLDSTVQITGNVMTHGLATTSVNLTNQTSFLRGVLGGDGTTNLMLTNNAVWAPTTSLDSYNLGNVTLNQGVIDLAWWSANQIAEGLATSDVYRTITLSNAKILGDSTLKINSDVQNGVADLFILEELDGDSNQNIKQYIQIGYDPLIEQYIANGNSEPFIIGTLGDPILIMEITDNNGKNIVGEAVSGITESRLNTYEVFGKISTVTENGSTYIYLGTLDFGITGDPSETVKVLDDTLGMLKWASRIQNDYLTQRMGDLRIDADSHKSGIWARTYFSELDSDSNYAGRSIGQKVFGGQLGFDKVYNKDNSKIFAGLFVDYQNSNNDYFAGTGKIQNIGLAAYGSWLSNAGHYVDLTARASKIDGDFDFINGNGDAVSADYDTHGMAFSAEYGYRIKAKSNWIIEPQAQFTYNSISGIDYELSNDVNVKYGNIDSAIGRIGLKVGREFDQGNVTAGLFYYNDFAGATDLTATAGLENYAAKVNIVDNWYRFNVNTSLNISADSTMSFELARLFGKGINNNWMLNAVFRIGF